MRVTGAITLAGVLLAASCTLASADGEFGAFDIVEGGDITSTLDVSLAFLYGVGARPDGLGRSISTANPGPHSVSANPAALAFLARGGIVVDGLPPVSASVSEFYDIETSADEEMGSAMGAYGADDLQTTSPTVDALIGQGAGLASGAAALRFGPFVGGASIERSINIGLDAVGVDFEAYGEAVRQEGDHETIIEMSAVVDASMAFSFDVDRTTFALASSFFPTLGAGVSISRYAGTATITGAASAEGMMDYGGDVYYFNDPSAAWKNDLSKSVSGDFAGEAYGWTAGLSWRVSESTSLDVLYSRAPSIALDGELLTIDNVSPAFTDDGIDPYAISPDEPTLTETREKVETYPVRLELPSYAGAALSTALGPVRTVLEYRRYSGTLGFAFQDSWEGVELTDGAGVELEMGVFRMGGGIIRGTHVGSEGGGEEVMIPLANAGLAIDIGTHFNIDALLLALPLQVLRVSVGYDF